MENSIRNNTCNGNCSGCGGCCTAFLPITKQELEVIRKYVKDNNIKPIERQLITGQYNMMCMFLDQETKKCKIYDVRPYVCKDFLCNHKDWKERRKKYSDRADYNCTSMNGLSINMTTFDDLLFDDPRPLLMYLCDYVKKNCKDENKESEMLLNLLHYVGRDDIAESIKFE